MTKDCTTCKYGFVDEQLGFPMCHHPSRFSEDCVDFNMHEEIEEPKKATGIEEKKLPEGLEEAAEQFVGYDMDTDDLRDFEVGIKAFIAGAEWMKAKMMEEAVEGEVYLYIGYKREAIAILVDIPKDKLGDKVKVIIIKED